MGGGEGGATVVLFHKALEDVPRKRESVLGRGAVGAAHRGTAAGGLRAGTADPLPSAYKIYMMRGCVGPATVSKRALKGGLA